MVFLPCGNGRAWIFRMGPAVRHPSLGWPSYCDYLYDSLAVQTIRPGAPPLDAVDLSISVHSETVKVEAKHATGMRQP